MRRAAFALLLPLLVPSIAAAQSTWKLDPSRSSIGFTVRHMVVSKAKGTFRKFSGVVVGDPATPDTARVEITIDAASIDTGNADRDGDLRSANFFEVAKYPTIVFRSKRIARSGAGLTLIGDLTMHGVTREVTLNVDRFALVGPDRVNATAKARVNRKDFGIVWNKALDGGGVAVADDVNIQIAADFVK